MDDHCRELVAALWDLIRKTHGREIVFLLLVVAVAQLLLFLLLIPITTDFGYKSYHQHWNGPPPPLSVVEVEEVLHNNTIEEDLNIQNINNSRIMVLKIIDIDIVIIIFFLILIFISVFISISININSSITIVNSQQQQQQQEKAINSGVVDGWECKFEFECEYECESYENCDRYGTVTPLHTSSTYQRSE